MAYTSEIEKLERRYAENPKGRNFAPLADAYRKAGQLDQAIELCTSGLEHHPDYVSAHIVYGRCFIDKRNDEDAATVFRKVLELDPENVIAFRVLAEIGSRSGRLDEAVAWLTKLLAADPMNGEAAEALAIAKGKASQAAKAATPVAPIPAPAAVVVEPPASEPVASPPPPPVALADPEPSGIVLDPEPVRPADLQVDAERESGDIEVFDGTMNFTSVSDTASADGIELQEEIVLQPREIEVEGLARSQYEASGLFKLDAEPEEDSGATVDLPLIMPDAEGDEYPAAVSPGRSTPAPSTGMPAAVTLSDDDGAADTAALSRAEPVLTETMAELYWKQGHQEEALQVYQALQAQRPGDVALRAKIEALSGGGSVEWAGPPAASGLTVQAFLRGILARRPGEAVAPEGGGEPRHPSPLDAAFATAAPDPDPPGEPTRAAPDDLSLDEVFGDDASGPGAGTASRPSGPQPAAAAAAAPAAPGGFSFDEFFNAGGAPPSDGAAAPPSAPPQAAGSRTKPPLEDDGDLDQFQSWLKGLKS